MTDQTTGFPKSGRSGFIGFASSPMCWLIAGDEPCIWGGIEATPAAVMLDASRDEVWLIARSERCLREGKASTYEFNLLLVMQLVIGSYLRTLPTMCTARFLLKMRYANDQQLSLVPSPAQLRAAEVLLPRLLRSARRRSGLNRHVPVPAPLVAEALTRLDGASGRRYATKSGCGSRRRG